MIKEILEVRKDIRYVIRPVIFGIEGDEKSTKLAIAAGLQGKFSEMHDAFLEYPKQKIPDDFIKETASLYGIDYDLLIKDSEGKEVQKIMKDNLKAFEHSGLYSVPSFMIKDKFYIVTDENLPDLKQAFRYN